MLSVRITDPNDRRYPFACDFFQNRNVVYHGSWSTYGERIERDGFATGALPFDLRDIATIYRAAGRLGRKSPLIIGADLRAALHSKNPIADPPLYLSSNFWRARAYATDGGGELLRMTGELADWIELVCKSSDVRAACIKRWEPGAKYDEPTRKVVDLLNSSDKLERVHSEVTMAKARLLRVVAGGHPVVYAIAVEPDWFGSDEWENYVELWSSELSQKDLSCARSHVKSNYILAKAHYPNGTEANFLPSWVWRWEDARLAKVTDK